MKRAESLIGPLKPNMFWALAIIITTFIFSCTKVNTNDCPNCPTVLQLIPDSAFVGDTITIIGEHLMPDPAYNDVLEVKINGNLIPEEYILYNDARNIQLVIPAGTQSGPVTVDLNITDGLLSRGNVNYFNKQSVTTYAGRQGKSGNDNGMDTLSTFTYPDLITVNPVNGDVYVIDRYSNLNAQAQNVRQIASNGDVSTLFTTPVGSTTDVIALKAIGCDNNGILFFAYSKEANEKATSLKQITIQNGNVNPVDISNNKSGHKDAPLDSARFQNITSIAFDSDNNMYVADGNYIRKITNSIPRMVTTIAGSGSSGYLDGPALSAQFSDPFSLVIDNVGNIYISDKGNYVVRKLSSGTVSTIAGTPGVRGFTYPDETSQAELGVLGEIATNYNGNIFLLEGRHCVRRINLSQNKINNLTGPLTGFPPGYEDGSALAARYNFPQGLAYDKKRGILYIADTYNHVIRKVIGN